MAKLIIEKWQCDRCKSVFDKRPAVSTRYSIAIDVDYGTAGGREVDWNEMCGPCNRTVSDFLHALKALPQTLAP